MGTFNDPCSTQLKAQLEGQHHDGSDLEPAGPVFLSSTFGMSKTRILGCSAMLHDLCSEPWQSQLSSLSFQFELRNQGTFGCCLLRRSAVGAELFHVQKQLGLEEVDVK